MKPLRALPLLFLTLLLACGSAPEPAPEYTFKRADFENRNFTGQIAGEPVEANFNLFRDVLQGELRFRNSGTTRRLQGKLSYEGFFRISARPTAADSTRAPLRNGPSSARGYFLTTGRILGTWKGAMSIHADRMEFGVPTPEQYEVKDGPEDQEDELEMSHWKRKVQCVNSNKDTTGTLIAYIPRFHLRPGGNLQIYRDGLKEIHRQIGNEMIYQPRCTCKSLERNGGGTQEFEVQNFSIQAGLLNLELIGKHNDQENLHLVQIYDLATGQNLRSDQDTSRVIP